MNEHELTNRMMNKHELISQRVYVRTNIADPVMPMTTRAEAVAVQMYGQCMLLLMQELFL